MLILMLICVDIDYVDVDDDADVNAFPVHITTLKIKER